jgi:hypothetical protein
VYWLAHLVMISGVVVAAAGVEVTIGALGRASPRAAPGLLAAGVAAYLAGEAAFRRLLRLGPAILRVATAGFALATAPLGATAGPLPQLAVLVAALSAMLVADRRSPA